MSLNKYQFQLVIVSEDENLFEVANGFHEGMGGNRLVHIESVEGKRRNHHGWIGAVESLSNYNLHLHSMRHVLLFIDFDNSPELRLRGVWQKVEELKLGEYKSRIHVIGVTRQSEDIDRLGMSFFDFGRRIAEVCNKGLSDEVWQQVAFKNNESELSRLRESVCCKLMQ